MIHRARKRPQGLAEVVKVLNQLHDYMDMHHNRYGYVITETEAIMFRRRGAYGDEGVWSRLEYSDGIPISAGEGELNAMMILWYFHVNVQFEMRTTGGS